jgi:hypothetical protein
MKHCFMAMCFSALTVSTALAQNGVGPVNYVASVHDDAPRQDSKSGGMTKEVTEAFAHPAAADKHLPLTLNVRTSALLELHEMRQSAVNLCLQLPAKYRTRLPQCADIFKHEIRLEALAKNKR